MRPSSTRTRSRRSLAILFGAVLGLAGAAVLLEVAGVSPRDLLARLRGANRGVEVLGIHGLDDELGYVLRPGASFRHREALFDVEYRIDGAGSRRVPGFDPARPRALVLGDSWTFGHGVEDEETWPARLQARRPDLGVRNLGVMGYGTAHALLALERALAAGDRTLLVLYGWTPIHLARTYLRRSHLRVTAGGRTPRLEFEGGELVSKGIADASAAIGDEAPGLARAEWVRTVAAVERMAELSAAHGARFAVVLLPGPADNPAFVRKSRAMTRRMKETDVAVLDLQADPTVSKAPDLYFPGDHHPNARWHEMVAGAVAARLASPDSPR